MFTGDWNETVVVNSAYEEVWGRSMSDLLADPGDFLEGVCDPDVDAVMGGMERLSGGKAVDLDFRVATDDGRRWMSVHAEPVMDDDGQIEYVAGYTRDVTELKSREADMRKLNEVAAELLETRDADAVGDVVVDVLANLGTNAV